MWKSISRPYLHLLDFQRVDLHATNHVGKQSYHVIVAHGHIGNNLLQSNLLGTEVLVLLAAARKLDAELCNFPLEWSTRISIVLTRTQKVMGGCTALKSSHAISRFQDGSTNYLG